MKMKKFMAPSMPEVMKKVRAELGPQAVILQSKTVYKGGMFGLFKKKNIEVVAAIDPYAETFERTAEAKPAPITVNQPAQVSSELRNEMLEVKQMIRQLKEAKPADFLYPDALQPVLDHLKRQGLSAELWQMTADHLLAKWKEERSEADNSKVRDWAVNFLNERLSLCRTVSNEGAKYFHLLGPTGVGKTTTLAKLASKKVLENGKRVAFITTDTYRIAAIEQLKTYAGLLDAPFKVAYSRNDMEEAFANLSKYDVLFIDTAGRNYREKQYVEDLQKMMTKKTEQSLYYLVLSAASKQEDLEEVIDNFTSIQLDGFIFTKLDETKTKGTIINLMYTYKVGTHFITNGQNVPDDLAEITPEMIIESLFEEFR
ncbi:flagellar biosynthesis protein FlhF [Domibacillus epiphyticus]|uniref:Flagellar biosynthesis protein FlhF n=1 Tax=Domibacillus epiphyticus TaxID=1714355 RepID=A0A1V2ACE5_9BACI|nr:flagellar biosynthesis protein FlhF [Domibacillus epiphyticus]OMP68620.1 flagellar biosynthesis protein FlhF [Domibacillus epiphyticus]